jgi:hypothetical protein
LGLITYSELYSIIQLQVREIILSTFAWTEGRYAFNFQDLAGRELIKLQTPPADLVLEGIRHHYTSDRLNHLITSKNRVLIQSENPNFRYQQLHLGSSDMKIFDAINGRSSIEKIIKKSEMPELNVLQLCYGLLAMKIIHDKVPK